MNLPNKIFLYCACMFAFLSACTPIENNNPNNLKVINSTENPTLHPSPTPTPIPIVNLNVCVASLPQSVDEIFGDQFINAALYGSVPNFFSDITGVVLTSFPSPINNSLYQKLTIVNLGDIVVNDEGEIVELMYGTRIKPAGCTDSDCSFFFDGTPFEMAQLVAIFDFNNKLVWEDSTPVTPADSVFAYQWELDNSLNASNYQTQSYAINDEGRVEWIGIPGFFTQRILDYFWTPLPQHQWDGKNASEITSDDVLSFGPFVIKEWNSDAIILEKNVFSNLVGTKINLITIREIPIEDEKLQQMISSGNCDVVDNNVLTNYPTTELISGEKNGDYNLISGNGNSWVSLYLGIKPYSYEDIYSMWGGDRADYFGNVEMRQYVSQCLKKDIGKTIFGDHGVDFNGLYPSNHPNQITLENSQSAILNLDTSTFLNSWPTNSEGIRYSLGNPTIFDGTLFELSLFFPDSPKMKQTAQLIASNLIECGISVSLSSGSSEELFQAGQEGLVFGRNFDLALIPWQTSLYSVCELLSSKAVPGEDLSIFPYGWGGWNATGWQSEAYDVACKQENNSFLHSDQFASSSQLSQTIMEQEVPIIPLYVEPSFWATSMNICGLQIDELTSEVIHIEKIDIFSDGITSCP